MSFFVLTESCVLTANQRRLLNKFKAAAMANFYCVCEIVRYSGALCFRFMWNKVGGGDVLLMAIFQGEQQYIQLEMLNFFF